VPRTLGIIQTTIWVDEDFRALSADAQRAYLMMISQPKITNCGVLAYVPGKMSRLAMDDSVSRLERAVGELEAGRFVVVDRETQELLVRTFVRHDKIEKQPRLKDAAVREFREIESPELRHVLRQENAELFGKLPEPRPLGQATLEGVGEPLAEGVGEGVSEPLRARAPAARAAPAPSPTPAPTPAAEDPDFQEPKLDQPRGEDDRDPAADLSLEPPPLALVSEIVEKLPGSDPDSLAQVEPLALQLPKGEFEQLVEKVKARANIGNPVGFFVSELRKAVRRHHAAGTAAQMERAAGVSTGSAIERLKREKPEDYVRAMATVFENGELSVFLERYVDEEDERIRLTDLAADLRAETAA
jgi:hypothetical protein